ncbi:MAG: hypothetical protein OQL20_10635, partial [Sedimenticola sp.]|nr:hypothetical protein [Sedimenticola sp.]
MNVGFASYLFAFVAYSALSVLLVTSWRGRTLGRLLIIASGCSALWALFSALATVSIIVFPPVLQLLEFSRDAFWCLFLLKSVQTNSSQSLSRRWPLTPARMYYLFLIVAGVITVL